MPKNKKDKGKYSGVMGVLRYLKEVALSDPLEERINKRDREMRKEATAKKDRGFAKGNLELPERAFDSLKEDSVEGYLKSKKEEKNASKKRKKQRNDQQEYS